MLGRGLIPACIFSSLSLFKGNLSMMKNHPARLFDLALKKGLHIYLWSVIGGEVALNGLLVPELITSISSNLE
jgi:hypothetical protein